MTDAVPAFRRPALLSHALAPAWVLALAGALVSFDVTAVAVILPLLRADLGVTLAGAVWVMDAYSLAFAGLLFAAGALADRYGRRRVLRLGNAAFALASLLCGLAWDGPSLWAARALQGAAAAFFITGGLAAISLRYPPAQPALRARAFSLIGMAGGAAMALGPTCGGLIAAEFGWRWVFLINLPLCLLADWTIRRVIAETREADGRPLDPLGVVLLTLAIALPVQALLQEGSTIWRWSGVALGGICAVALVWQQRRRSRRQLQPMLDPALFLRRAPLGIVALLLCLSASYWAVLIYLPLWLQAAHALETAQSGLAMLAATVPMLLLPPAGVRLTQRYGWRVLFSVAMLLLAVGMAALSLAVLQQMALPWALLAIALAASGAGLGNAQVSGALVALAPADRAGMASALATVLRQAGFALGIALFGAVAARGYGVSFAVAALAAVLGALAAAVCLPRQLGEGGQAQ